MIRPHLSFIAAACLYLATPLSAHEREGAGRISITTIQVSFASQGGSIDTHAYEKILDLSSQLFKARKISKLVGKDWESRGGFILCATFQDRAVLSSAQRAITAIIATDISSAGPRTTLSLTDACPENMSDTDAE